MAEEIKLLSTQEMMTGISFTIDAGTSYIAFSEEKWKKRYQNLFIGKEKLPGCKHENRLSFVGKKSQHPWFINTAAGCTVGQRVQLKGYTVPATLVPEMIRKEIRKHLELILGPMDSTELNFKERLDAKYKKKKNEDLAQESFSIAITQRVNMEMLVCSQPYTLTHNPLSSLNQ